METLGWIVLVIVSLYLGLMVFLTIGNMGGNCNIGGVPNKWYERLSALVILPCAYASFVWYIVIANAPFQIVFK